MMKITALPIIVVRVSYFFLAYITYLIQVALLLCGFRQKARFFLEYSARLLIKMLGLDVHISPPPKCNLEPIIYIANHDSPIDVLVVQGYFKMCSLTTAADYFKFIFPFSAKSMENYGHVLLKHKDQYSRRSSYYKFSEILRNKGSIIAFPSGSIVTKITKRVSPSCYYQAIANNAVIIPIFFHYQSHDEIEHVREKITQTKTGRFKHNLLFYRLINRKTILRCTYGEALYPSNFLDKDDFCNFVKNTYLNFELQVTKKIIDQVPNLD